MILDIGEEEGKKADRQGKRVPKWILPRVEEEIRNKMRPDIMYITGVSEDPASEEEREEYKRDCRIHIVEVGYGMDWAYNDKLKDKSKQHKRLIKELEDEGWKVEWNRTIILGVGGTTYKDTRSLLVDDLGYEEAEADRYIHKIQKIAVERTDQAIRCRRNLEHGREAPQDTPPPKGVGGGKIKKGEG